MISESPEPQLKLRDADIATRGFDDETIVLDVRSSTYFSTNAAGSVLWRELQQGTTRSQLMEVLRTTFEISSERAAGDVDTFLADCRQRGLLGGA